MGFLVKFYLICQIAYVLKFGNHHPCKEEKNQAAESNSSFLVALSSKRTLLAQPSTPVTSCQSFEEPSFQRQFFHRQDQQHHGGIDQRTVEMSLLHEAQQDECAQMRQMRHNVASMHRQFLRPWHQGKAKNLLELCGLGRRRYRMDWTQKGFQVAESKQCKEDKRIHTKGQQAQEQRKRFGTCPRSTMEFEAVANYAIDNDSVISQHRSKCSCATTANFGQQAPDEGSSSLPSGDTRDHCGIHQQACDFEEHAPSSPQSRSGKGQVQSSYSGQAEAAHCLEQLCRREHQEMAIFCRGFHKKGCGPGEGSPFSTRDSPRIIKSPPGRGEGPALKAGCRSPGHRGDLRWRAGRGKHEGRHCGGHPKEYSLCGGQPSADQSTTSGRDPRRNTHGQKAKKRWIGLGIWSAFAFPWAGQIDFSEVCPRPTIPLCFHDQTTIWNHSFIDDEDYISPWEASIDAVDLAHEVGMGEQRSFYTLVECVKKPSLHRVRFHPEVDLYVGAEEDFEMAWLMHSIGVPHQYAPVLCREFQFPRIHGVEDETSYTTENSDLVSLLAAQPAHRDGHQVELPREGPQDAILDNRDIARDPDDLSPVSSVSTASSFPIPPDSEQSEEDWYTTLIYTLDGGPGTLWLNWKDYQDMHMSVARALTIHPADLFYLHNIEVPPQDVNRAQTGVVIAQRKHDLPVGSTERFTLLDVEFHAAQPLVMPEVVRRARLLPDVISREQLLRGLGLYPFCLRSRNRCLIWVNEEIIAFGAPRVYLSDGDYIRIAVPPGSPGIDHISTRCLATAFHQGHNIEEILMRHTLFRVGWHEEPIGPPYVPRMRSLRDQHDEVEGEGALFLQVHRVVLPPLEEPPPLPDCVPGKVKARLPEELPYQQNSLDSIRTNQIEAPQGIQAEPAVIQQIFMHWVSHAFADDTAREEGDRVMEIDTWYLDMPRYLSCEQHRTVALRQDFTSWLRIFAGTWNDLLDPFWPIDLHVVRPTPPATATQRQRRLQVIVVQRVPHDGVSNLFTIVTTGPTERPVRHSARFAPLHLSKPQAIAFAGVADRCYPELSSLQCMVWHGDLQIEGQIAIRNRHGVGIVIIIQILQNLQRTQYANSQDAQHEHMNVWEEDDGGSLLQVSKAKKEIYLEELLPVGQDTTAVRLLDCTSHRGLPNPLEIPMPGTATQVQEELSHWGHRCEVFACPFCNIMLCVDETIPVQQEQQYQYMFCHDDVADENGCFAHSSTTELDEVKLMTLLCSLGYPRAVILEVLHLSSHWIQVQFHHREPEIQPRQPRQRTRSAWPTRSGHRRTNRPLVLLHEVEELDNRCQLHTAFDVNDLHHLFGSTEGVLCHDFAELTVPEECQQILATMPCRPMTSLTDLDQYDRLLIFTDGSSIPQMRRLAPLHADSLGHPDTWAFIVVGEKYINDNSSQTCLLGWTAQPVRYDPLGSAYTGIQRIGSDMAERSALIAAAMWRIGLNHSISTTICTDSATGGGQAAGLLGTETPDESFHLLRALYQALEAALPPGALQICHTRAHAGEVFNELADAAARMEAKKSFHHRRQDIDLRLWTQKFLQLWTLFGHRNGFNVWQNGGIAIPKPSMPQPQAIDEAVTDSYGNDIMLKFAFSIGTGNVQSLYRTPDGHAGKLHYLQAQMRKYKFNCLVLQETRSEQGFSSNGNILRFCSGHCGHHLGIEIWIDIETPFAFGRKGKPYRFQSNHFQIAHSDPRRMLLRCDTGIWSLWLLAIHAPHSGYTAQERAEWWKNTTEIVDQYHDGDALFLAGDANAAPGPADYKVVCREGFATSANTNEFRQILQHFDLHLPATGPAHVGDNATWTNFAGTDTHCIDHIALPSTWASRCTHSCVVEDFDLGTAHEDHKLAAAQLEWWESIWIPQQDAKVPVQHSTALLQPSLEMRQAIDDFAHLPWQSDIEAHTQHAAQHIHTALTKCTTPDRSFQAKKPYISDEIWQLRNIKLKSRKQMKRHRNFNRLYFLRKCFRAWSSGERECQEQQVYAYETSLLCRDLTNFVKYKNSCGKLKTALKCAKQKELDKTLHTIDASTPSSQVLRSLRSFTGPTNPKKQKRKCLPNVRDHHGQTCSLPSEALAVWINYFKDMEAGERMPSFSLRNKWIQELHLFAQDDISVQLSDLPSLTDLEIALRRVPRGRACGPDGIPGEICHHFANSIAKILYQHLVLLVTHGQEDLSSKGGIVAPVYKGRGPADLCSSYRSILVSNHTGKAMHRAIRQKHAPLYEKFLQMQQKGGRRKTPVQLAMHQVRAFARQAKHTGHSVSIIYLDLTEAFYRIIREVPIGGDPSDELIAHIVNKLRLPQDALHQIDDLLADQPAIEQAGMGEMDCRCVRAIHASTHFWLRHQADVVRTRAGTRPGDCFADFIFGFAWSCVLQKLEAYMTENQVIAQFEDHDEPLCSISAAAPAHGATSLVLRGWTISQCAYKQTALGL